MPAPRLDRGFLEIAVEGAAFDADGGGGFDGEADHQVLAGGNAAQHAAIEVGLEDRPVLAHAHFVGGILAAHGGRAEAGPDLDALHGIDRHHRHGQITVQLAIDGRAPAGRHAGHYDFDNRAGGGAVLAQGVHVGLPESGGFRIGAEEGVLADRIPVPALTIDGAFADLDQGGADGDAIAQNLAGNPAGGDTHGGLAGRRAAAAAIIADAVFHVIGVVRMAGPPFVADIAIILRAGIDILDQEADRCAGGDRTARTVILERAGQDTDLVGLLARGDMPARARAAQIQPGLEVVLGQGNAGRAAVDNRADGRSMAFAPGGDPEKVSERIVRHVEPACFAHTRRGISPR